MFNCIVDAHNDVLNYTNGNLLVTLDDDFSLYGGEISNAVINVLEDVGVEDIQSVFFFFYSASTNGEYNQILKVRLKNGNEVSIEELRKLIVE